MSVALRVWIGIDPGKAAWEDGHADARTVAPDADTCLDRIASLGAEGVDLEPREKHLILKGRISDR